MLVTARGKTVKLPDFINIGAAKCGTTTLYYCLIQHPKIFMPKHKEPRFFNFMEQPPSYCLPHIRKDEEKEIVWKFDDYIKIFEDAKSDQVLGEGSVGYLYAYKQTIEHIKTVYGDKYKKLKITAILRNPVERAFSHYIFHIERGMEALSFEKAINPQIVKSRIKMARGFDYIGFGMYYKQIKAYLEEFPLMRIYLIEDLKNTDVVIKDYFEFLQIDDNVEINTNLMANPSGIPKSKFLVKLLQKIGTSPIKKFFPQKCKVTLASMRDNFIRKLSYKPKMDDLMREKLINLYEDDILQLQELIKRNLSHWLDKK